MITGEVQPCLNITDGSWVLCECNQDKSCSLTRTTDPWINVPLQDHGTHLYVLYHHIVVLKPGQPCVHNPHNCGYLNKTLSNGATKSDKGTKKVIRRLELRNFRMDLYGTQQS